MRINIKDKEIELRRSFRAYITYESITGKSFEPKNLTDLITFFYSVVMSSDLSLNVDFNEFIDELDNNPEWLNDFIEFLNESDKRDKALTPESTKSTKPSKPKKKS